MAWVQKEVIDNNYNGKKRRVIYATRTHSQISQTLRELQKTAYKNVKVGIMASRQHLCVNSTIKSTASPLESQYKCKQTVTNASCPFYQNITQAKNAIEVRLAVDIEDLCKASEVHRGCPYYIAKERCDVADLIMMPYNVRCPMKDCSLKICYVRIQIKDYIIKYNLMFNILIVFIQPVLRHEDHSE